jgi:hypothetical protein
MMMGGIEGWSTATGNDLQSNPHNDKKPNAEDGLATSANVIGCIRNKSDQDISVRFHTKQPFADLPTFTQARESNDNSQISSAALHLDGDGGEISHSSDIRFVYEWLFLTNELQHFILLNTGA